MYGRSERGSIRSSVPWPPLDERKLVGRAQRREEIARLEAEVAEARPYIGLAREVQREVDRVTADPSVSTETLSEAIDAVPRRERLNLARAIFDRLSPDRQWDIIERAFDDDELR